MFLKIWTAFFKERFTNRKYWWQGLWRRGRKSERSVIQSLSAILYSIIHCVSARWYMTGVWIKGNTPWIRKAKNWYPLWWGIFKN